MPSLNELLQAPFENCKINGFWAALEDDDQPASSYRLPVIGASAEFRLFQLVIFIISQ